MNYSESENPQTLVFTTEKHHLQLTKKCGEKNTESQPGTMLNAYILILTTLLSFLWMMKKT